MNALARRLEALLFISSRPVPPAELAAACLCLELEVAEALQALRDQLGKRFRAGVIFYTGDQLVPFGDKLWLVPLPLLWSQ